MLHQDRENIYTIYINKFVYQSFFRRKVWFFLNFIWATISKLSVYPSVHPYVYPSVQFFWPNYPTSICPPLEECFKTKIFLACPNHFLPSPKVSFGLQNDKKGVFIKYACARYCWKGHGKEISKNCKMNELPHSFSVPPRNWSCALK